MRQIISLDQSGFRNRNHLDGINDLCHEEKQGEMQLEFFSLNYSTGFNSMKHDILQDGLFGLIL